VERPWRRVATGLVMLPILIATCGSPAQTLAPGATASALVSPPAEASAVVAPGTPGAPTEGAPTEGALQIDAAVWNTPADPLHVDVELEAAAAATQTIGAGGGSVAAVGGDGTRYTLTIPAQRQWSPTKITLTPITTLSAGGKAAGPGVVFGVQLEPGGLELYPDASLVIEPATSLDDQAIVYFGYDGAGEDAGLQVPDLRAPGHVLALSHFSGAGIVRRTGPPGGAADESGVYEVLADQVASRVAADRLAHVMAQELARERDAQLAGQEVDHQTLVNTLAAVQASYLSEVIEPLIAVASHAAATCEQATEAVAAVFQAARQRELLGAGDDQAAMARVIEAFDAAAERLVPLVEAACRRDAARSCRETGDLLDVVRRNYAERRAKGILGGASEAELDAGTEAYTAILRWCGVYELTWTSTGLIDAKLYTVSSVFDGHMTLRYVEDAAGDLSKI